MQSCGCLKGQAIILSTPHNTALQALNFPCICKSHNFHFHKYQFCLKSIYPVPCPFWTLLAWESRPGKQICRQQYRRLSRLFKSVNMGNRDGTLYLVLCSEEFRGPFYFLFCVKIHTKSSRVDGISCFHSSLLPLSFLFVTQPLCFSNWSWRVFPWFSDSGLDYTVSSIEYRF